MVFVGSTYWAYNTQQKISTLLGNQSWPSKYKTIKSMAKRTTFPSWKKTIISYTKLHLETYVP